MKLPFQSSAAPEIGMAVVVGTLVFVASTFLGLPAWLVKFEESLRNWNIDNLAVSILVAICYLAFTRIRRHAGGKMGLPQLDAARRGSLPADGRFRAIVEHTQEGVLVVDPDEIVEYANPRFCEMTGFSNEELIGRAAHDVLLEPEAREAMLTRNRDRRVGRAERYEILVRTKSGQLMTLLVSACPLFDSTGRFAGSFAINTDITSRKIMEASLAEAVSTLTATLEATADGILVADLDGKIVHVNRRTLELWGIPDTQTEQLDGARLLDFVLAQVADPEKFLAIVEKTKSDATAETSDQVFLNNGRIYELYSRPQALAGLPIGRVWSLRNVTDRVRADEDKRRTNDLLETRVEQRTFALQEANERLEVELARRTSAELAMREAQHFSTAVVNGAGEGIVAYDLGLHCLVWNPQMERLTGLPASEVLGRRVPDVIPDGLEKPITELLGRAFRGEHVAPSDLKFRSAGTGEERWCRAKYAPHRNGSGEIIGAIGIVTDITDRKRAEVELQNSSDALERRVVERTAALQSANVALQDSERRYRDLIDNAPDLILSITMDGTVTAINDTVQRMTGYSQEELVGRSVFDFVLAEYVETIKAATARKLKELELTSTYEVVAVARDGHHIVLEVKSWLLYKSNIAIGIQAVMRDVTERKQLEGQLRQAQKLEAIGLLAGGIAHDFNNLLTAIIGFGELLSERLEGNRELQPFVAEIRKAGDQAAALTRQLLAYSRRQILQPETLDLNKTVRSMATILQRVLGEDVTLELELADSGQFVSADDSQLQQVILNLGVNARDAMPEGGTLTIGTATVHLDDASSTRMPDITAGTYVVLTVDDTGHGMDESTAAKVFEPFFTTKAMGHGTGLGLATVYGIVKQSGGHITVASELGRGATFRVYFPAIDNAAVMGDVESPVFVQVDGTGTILLVEDEPAVRAFISETLSAHGYRVLEADAPQAALALADEFEEKIDLLVTDVVMPGMSGPELARRLTMARPSLRVLCMSGYADHALIQRGALKPGASFIGKPFSPGALLAKVKELLSLAVA